MSDVVKVGQVWCRNNPSPSGRHLKVEQVRGSYVYATPCDALGEADIRFMPNSVVLRVADLDGDFAYLVWEADGVPDLAELDPTIAARMLSEHEVEGLSEVSAARLAAAHTLVEQGRSAQPESTPAQRVRKFAEAHARRSAANGVQPEVVSHWVTLVDGEERPYVLTVADLLAVTSPAPSEPLMTRDEALAAIGRLVAGGVMSEADAEVMRRGLPDLVDPSTGRLTHVGIERVRDLRVQYRDAGRGAMELVKAKDAVLAGCESLEDYDRWVRTRTVPAGAPEFDDLRGGR